MKMMGVDYGEKRIGIALTDDSGQMAFPKTVLPNDRFFWKSFSDIIASSSVSKIIIGHSLNRDGTENEIMQRIRTFVEKLKKEFDIEVDYESEAYTSEQAKRIQFEGTGAPNPLLDASAAALILNSYIDRHKK